MPCCPLTQHHPCPFACLSFPARARGVPRCLSCPAGCCNAGMVPRAPPSPPHISPLPRPWLPAAPRGVKSAPWASQGAGLPHTPPCCARVGPQTVLGASPHLRSSQSSTPAAPHRHLKSQEPAARRTLLGCQSRLSTVERMGFLMCLQTHLRGERLGSVGEHHHPWEPPWAFGRGWLRVVRAPSAPGAALGPHPAVAAWAWGVPASVSPSVSTSSSSSSLPHLQLLWSPISQSIHPSHPSIHLFPISPPSPPGQTQRGHGRPSPVVLLLKVADGDESGAAAHCELVLLGGPLDTAGGPVDP